MADRSTVPSPSSDRYAVRVHAVMDHVRGNLAGDLSLSKLARVAHFSPYHFHRMFKAITGETVADFTRRSRLERAVELMRGAPGRELGSIGIEVGFATPSDFSRLFRARYGVAPSRWDRVSPLKPAQAGPPPDASGSGQRTAGAVETGAAWEPRVIERSAEVAAYVRVKDPWRGSSLAQGFEFLTGWLAEWGVETADQQMVGLSWESDKATPSHRVVYDLAITLPDGFEEPSTLRVGTGPPRTDRIGIHRLAGGRAVEVHCSNLRQTAAAWEYLYGEWLPDSNYEPADRPCAKWFRAMPERFDAQAWDVDCSVPLRPRLG